MRQILGYPNYSITGDGKVFSKGREIKPWLNFNGYLRVTLWHNGRKSTHYVHRLVAIAYLPNPGNLPQVDHIDQNKGNNQYMNLRWATTKANIRHSFGEKYPSMTLEQRSQIDRLHSEGKSLREISETLNLKGVTIQHHIRVKSKVIAKTF